MGVFDSIKRTKNGRNGDPELSNPSTLSEAANIALENQNAARARENLENTAVENAGVPPVNKTNGSNKMVAALSVFVAFAVVAALLVAVNTDKGPKKKKKEEEAIQNSLPPLFAPTVPSSLSTGPTPGAQGPLGAQVPAIKPGSPGAQPIGLQGNKSPVISSNGINSKPAPDWTDRKMSGTLLLPAPFGATSALNLGPTPVASERDSTASLFPSAGRTPLVGNDLSARLEPTITKGVSAAMLADRNFLITKGTTLDCALETALNSTVPGLTTCRLTRDVYSDNGQIILLDRGSQLTGEYQGGLKQGQVRLFVLWSRAKTPNGVVIALNSPGADALGRSGLEGWVDNHFMERFGAAILMSFIQGTVASIANNHGTGTTNIYGSTAASGEKVIEKILDASVGISPTIIKNQGDHIQVMVARDLDFASVYSLRLKK